MLTAVVAVLGVTLPSFGFLGAAGLAAVAGIFQVLSVIVSSQSGPTEDTVRMQLLNALQQVRRLEELQVRTERVYETGTEDERRRLLGEISSAFTYLQDNATINFHGWASIYPNLVLHSHPSQP
jgi:hypothetical protein